MKGHFYKNLNLHSLIIERQPKVVVEVGAGEGDCTRLLAATRQEVPYTLHVISDKKLSGLPDGIAWQTGISYQLLKNFEDSSIDLCIIDTDHNYWTLKQELQAVMLKIREGGLIVMHDVDEFYHNTGLSDGYWDDSAYPKAEIMESVKYGSTGLALIDFLSQQRGLYQLIRWIPEHFGCAVIQRKTIEVTSVISPGPGSVFARPKP